MSVNLESRIEELTEAFARAEAARGASPTGAPNLGARAVAALIDHTALKPETTGVDIERLCEEARREGFASVCVNPFWVPLAAGRLRASAVRVGSVAGFPLGASLPSIKRAEAAEAVKQGAREVDMVLNVGALRGADYAAVRADIAGVAEAVHAGGALLKVIFENALLTDRQKIAACLICDQAGADFVKTSTGFGPSGAIERDVRLMRFASPGRMKVKAAGGIRTLDDVARMLAAGADRIGASAGVKIVQEASRHQPSSAAR